jgi:hypothetical protein
MADETKILASIKAAFGLQEGYDPFDTELTMHINSALSTLNQLGVGPEDGLVIDSETAWSALLGEDERLENVKSYVFLRVKMLFDANAMTQHVVAATQKMIEELEHRITITTDPLIPQLVPDDPEDAEV